MHDIDLSALTTTVSGALDRLQNEAEAPVMFDTARKLWVYRHRDKTLDQLSSISDEAAAARHQRQRTKRKFKLDPDPVPVPSPDTETAAAAAVTSPSKTQVQKIIVKGSDGKVIPLSSSTLQKLISAGAIKPGTQIATPDFSPDAVPSPGVIRIVQQQQPGTATSVPSASLAAASSVPSLRLSDLPSPAPRPLVLSAEQFSQLQTGGKLK